MVFAIALMIMDRRLESFASIRSALSLPVASLQYIVNWPTQLITELRTTISAHDELVRENLSLKAEQLLLRSKLQRLIAVESENNYLKMLVRSSDRTKSKTLIAELLNVAAEPFVHQAVVDKGSREGVSIGQPVLDATGVMGQVISVGFVTSRILLINDPRSGVAVQNSRTGMRAIVSGDNDSDKLRLMYVPKTMDVKIGDLFITSGLGDRYPEGYPVGKVMSIEKDPAQQFSIIYLQPSAHLNSSRQVLLVWYQKNA